MQAVLGLVAGMYLCSVASASVAAPPDYQNTDDRISYSVGHQVAGDLKANGVRLNKEALMRAVEDVIADAKPAVSAEDMRATLVEFKRKIVFADKNKRQQTDEKRRQESRAFMRENGNKDGVMTTASGLQYRIVQEGQGKSPQATDEVTVNYRGATLDNQEFDSSARQGKALSVKLNQVIPGWTEGLQLMKEGGKIKLFIPYELAYGDRGPLADRALIFDVELLAVKTVKSGP